MNALNFEQFREQWTAKYLGGFVVHSQAFDGLNGDFPIGFLVWDTSKSEPLTEVETLALDKDGNGLGRKKFFNVPNSQFLSCWLPRLKATAQNIPLKNAIKPQNAYAKVTSWHEDAIGYMLANGNDSQQAGTLTATFSSIFSSGNGFYITRENLWKVAVVFSVRRLIKPTWLNNRDQFLQPTGELLTEFKSDCILWMLFNGSNLSAGANDLEWNGRKWVLLNHFIPFTEKDVGANDRFESDFMSVYLSKLKLSKESQRVMNEGRALWSQFHGTRFEKRIREDLKLNRSDVGWYQIRKALEENAGNETVDFEPFKEAYDELTQKLRPQVFKLGFLRA